MSQEQILKFLKENPEEWFSSKQIKDSMKLGNVPIISLKKLRRGYIDFKITKPKQGGLRFLYRHKESEQ